LKNNNLVEKLSLQVASFQEGFEILCKSYNFNEMVKNFLHLLRGNFLISDIVAYHKKQSKSEWEIIVSKSNFDKSDLSFLTESSNLSVTYLQNQKYDVSIILPLSEQSVLGILIGHKMDKSSFSAFDKITLQILLQVFDSAHKAFLNQRKEKALIFELNEKIVQLNNLIETGIEITRYDKKDFLFELALERITSLTNASSAILQIIKNDKVEEQLSFPKGINFEEVLTSKFKLESGFEFNHVTYLFTLAEKETRNGITNFDEIDKLLIDAIAKQVQASIEYQYLNSLAIEKEIMEQELNVAASIQHRILPEKLPLIDGYDLAGVNIPSSEVSGDYYDCVNLGNGKTAMIIADVAGKGIGAALLVSTLNAALYSYLQFDIPLAEMADRLNKLIYKSSPPDKFITFFIAVLNSSTGELDIVNAGHNPILLLRSDGAIEKIDAGGIGLGMFDFGIPFTGQKLLMNSGDKLFLYTDGIPEAMNENEEEYSDEKMINFLKNNSGLPAKEFIDLIVKDVKEYVGRAKQSDDITVLILKKD
jgi:sigma-B regulation protein RsbU (phosphoserine phosphatase)